MQEIIKPRLFLVTLVAATALGPLAMQIFLPSLPLIQSDLGVSAATAQLVLSLSMVAISFSMLVYGPLSDRFGRRPLLILGLALFLVGSLVGALAPDITTLVVGRTIQAVGGAAGLVLTRTIIRDIYGRERAASMIAYVTTAMVIAPMLAPAIGGVINEHFGWRANFAFVGLAGILVTALVVARLPETHDERESFAGVRNMIVVFAQLLRNPEFRGFALQSSFAIATFFAFAAAAPYVVIVVMGRPASMYGVFFIAISFAFMIGNFIAGRISERVGVERMVLLGSGLAVLGTFLSLVCLLTFGWVPWSLFGPVVLLGLGNGISMPNAIAGAISVDPRVAGAASGLVGFLQMLVAALFAQLAGMWQNGTPYPMIGFMIAAATLSLAAFALSSRRKPVRG
ncbi:MAG: multidrug effflux MFS transporter [Proteobacteria bacterium]|nr:multidrug effflux MFS transporter [Pseudomonadota bacterium]